jgi:hypothetical protein
MPEPRVVVEHREHLWYLLAEASQLEHMIMCQYLFAEFTLKESTDEGLTEDQLVIVDRWRKTLRGIAVQEMLHLALVSNVMVAIGAAPVFGRPNFPQMCGYFPSNVQLDLLPFGEAALKHFLYLERPEGMELVDAEGFVPCVPPRTGVQEGEDLPRGQEFQTIGHLYRGLGDGMRDLCAQMGESGLFVGPRHAQATPELFQWPDIVAVTDLESALRALGEIIEQGEGARGDWQNAHYGQFFTMWNEYQKYRDEDPTFEPTRPATAVYTRQPFDSQAPVPIIGDPDARAVADVFNLGYEVLIHLLMRLFTPSDETDEQRAVLLGAAIDVMAGVVAPLGRRMTTLPAGPEFPGRTAGPAFEMFYQMTGLQPWQKSAWALLHERAELLADRCARVPGIGTVPAKAAAVAQSLAAHR